MDFTSFLRFLIITLFLIHQSQAEIADNNGASVVFIDSPTHQYLRQNVQTDSMSIKEVGAAVSVLLGLGPADLSAASSAKLNELLMPNPFDRPGHVFLLEIGLTQDSQAMVYANSALFSSGIKSKVNGGEGSAEIELPDKEQVAFFSLDGPADVAISNKETSDFASSIGGSFDILKRELVIPLPSGSKMILDMSKKADRKFGTGLMHLINSVKEVSEKKELSSNDAELVGGYFDGIKVLQEEYGTEGLAQQGMELLLSIVSRVFDTLQAGHKGEAVAVFIFGKAHSSESQRMVDVTFASRSAVRSLEEVDSKISPTRVAEIILVRTTTAWFTGIFLLITAIIGVYLLLGMPVTKDTLLYCNVKMD